MSDTPISDSTPHNVADLGMLCRRLERKLAATRRYLGDVSERVKQLEIEKEAVNDRIRLLIAERDTARLQADQRHSLREEFRELLGTDDIEKGVAAVREMERRIKRLEEAGDELICHLSHHIKTDHSDPIWHSALIKWGKVKKEAKQ